MFPIASIVLLISGLLGTGASLAAIAGGLEGGSGWAVAVVPTATVITLIHIVTVSLHYRTPYQFQTGYLVCLELFHLSITYLIATGAINVPGWSSGPFSVKLEEACWLVTLALSAFSIGAGMEMMRSMRQRRPTLTLEYVNTVRHNAYWLGVGLVLASVVFFAMALMSYGNLLSYTRAEMYSSRLDSRGWGLFTMTFPSAATLMVVAARTRLQMMVAAAVAGVALLIFMLSGYRTFALFPLAIGAIMWRKSGRKIPTAIAVSSVAVALVAISMVGMLRNMGSYEKLSMSDVQKSYEKANVTDSLLSMGQTLGLAAHVLEFVPKEEPYRYGRSYWIAIKGCVPNIGSSVDASEGRQAAKRAVQASKEAVVNMVPSDWMTYKILREQYDQGFGTGFTSVGEAYLNFGALGVFVVFFLHGWFLNNCDRQPIYLSLPRFIFLATMLNGLYKTVRNDFGNFTKPAAFIAIILLVWWMVLKILRVYRVYSVKGRGVVAHSART